MDLISELKVALTIARTKSLSAASRELNMTVSTASRRLDELEEKLKTRLFNRTTKGLFLTDDGDALLIQGQELVERADNLINTSALQSNKLSGILRVTAPARFGQNYIAPVAAQIMLEHPNLSIDLACTDQIQNLEESGFDLAIRIGFFGQDSNIVRKLLPNRRILVASPQWLQLNNIPTRIQDLAGCDGLMLGNETSWKLKSTNQKCIEITPRIRFRSRFGDVVREICEEGCGIALKSSWDVVPAIKAGKLVQLFPDYQQDSVSDITLVMPSRKFVSERTKVFAEAVQTALRSTNLIIRQ